MIISKKFMASRFARRVLVLFLLAALVPVAVSAFISYRQVETTLTDKSMEELGGHARSHGLMLMDKLSFADAVLGKLGERPELLREGAKGVGDHGRWFTSIAWGNSEGQFETLFGNELDPVWMPRDLSARLQDGSTVLHAVRDRAENTHLLMLRSIKAQYPAAGYLVARLNGEYLWGEQEEFPYQVDFCAVADSGLVMNCSVRVPPVVTGRLASFKDDAQLGALHWVEGDRRYVGNHWHLSLNSRFVGDNWSILAMKPESAAFAALSGFTATYLKMIAFSLVLVAFLSLHQIRRSLIPLEKLVAGARRLARRDFSVPIDVSSGDEFQHLADSMNDMGERLGRQFQTLDILARVDRLILSSTGVEPVLEIVLNDIGEIIACDYVCVGLIDEDSNEHIRVHISDPSGKRGSSITRENLTFEQKRFLNQMAPVEEFSGVTQDFGFLSPLFRAGAKRAAVFTIHRGNEAVGFIGLGYDDSAAPDTEQLKPVRDFADRIAVALASTEHEEHLYQQAHFDALTGLPNRQLFKDRLSQEIAHARRENRLGALMFIDLDNFKRINDSLGHTVGDELLCAAAKRLQHCVRDADTVARLGGDEFTIIISGINTAATASTIADAVLRSFAKPFFLGKVEYFITASIGITLFPDDGVEPEVLLQNADTAMYRAKNEGRARKAFFEDSMHALAVRRLHVEAELRKALEKCDQFRLEYQPQVGLADGSVKSVEALIRWHHPDHGVIPPDEFISVAEETGLIYEIGLWVLRAAAQQFQSWKEQRLDIDRVSVNVSTRQFQSTEFASDVRTILLETGLRTTELELEITESLVADNRPKVVQTLHDLHCMGIQFAIDDFGTGFSSLSHLRKFKYDTIKIDRAFVVGLPDQPDATGITTAIVRMAHTLGKKVVAEGIEDEQQLAFLEDIGCDQVQGFYFARPLDAARLSEFVQELEIKPLRMGQSRQRSA